MESVTKTVSLGLRPEGMTGSGNATGKKNPQDPVDLCGEVRRGKRGRSTFAPAPLHLTPRLLGRCEDPGSLSFILLESALSNHRPLWNPLSNHFITRSCHSVHLSGQFSKSFHSNQFTETSTVRDWGANNEQEGIAHVLGELAAQGGDEQQKHP